MISERTCIVCRKKSIKENFIKFVHNKNNEILIADDKYLDGRGAYVCNDKNCLKTCIKKKSLNRSFKFQVSQEFYEEIARKFGIE